MKATVGHSADYSIPIYLLARPYLGHNNLLVYVDVLFMIALGLGTIRDILPLICKFLERK